MATVYRAWHCLLDQPVALKMLRPEYSSVPEIAERFLQEARAVARLRNKHAVRVMDFGGTVEGNRYMVLELLNGRDLQHLLTKEGAQPVERAVAFVLQAAEALAEAHSTGLVHRDIKPANLFLAKENGTELVKVIDFGICKSLCRKSEYRTLSKSYLGSPQYMSPEQIQSAASVDARTDIWSLGVPRYRRCAHR
jgi:serine/threonine-protein kinase